MYLSVAWSRVERSLHEWLQTIYSVNTYIPVTEGSHCQFRRKPWPYVNKSERLFNDILLAPVRNPEVEKQEDSRKRIKNREPGGNNHSNRIWRDIGSTKGMLITMGKRCFEEPEKGLPSVQTIVYTLIRTHT